MSLPKALIVEDDEELALIFSEALKATNYDTEVIHDGQVASEKLTVDTPHLVLLDMHLPNKNGLALLKQIRIDERLKNTRIIIATADDSMVRNMEYKADLILLKPVDFYQLKSLSSRFYPR